MAPQYDAVPIEKIFSAYRANQLEVIVEIDESLGQSRDPPHQAFDRSIAEGRQVLFESVEEIAVVDYPHAIFVGAALESFDQRRRLLVDDEVDRSDPWREAQQRGDAIVDFAAVAKAGRLGGRRSGKAGLFKEGLQSRTMRRVAAIDPGDDCIDVERGRLRLQTSPPGLGDQATNNARIFFSALASIWRTRSAETPYSSASSCKVALGSPRKRRFRMSRS